MNKKRTSSKSSVAEVERLDRFADIPGVWLTIAGAAYYQVYYQELTEIDMKPSWVTALAFAEAEPGITQSQLSRRLKINRASAMALCNQLEERGYIERSKLARLNQTAIHATALGLEKLDAGCETEKRLSRRLLGDLGAAEQEKLVATLKKTAMLLSSEDFQPDANDDT